MTTRRVIHPPVAKSCTECHGAHGAPSRNVLKAGEGKKQCYACHQPVDKGKNKHAALERYGCVGCHDPHGTAYGRLVPKRVNDLCLGLPREAGGREARQPDGQAGHVLGGDLVDPRRPNRDFTCASCHNPHGSDSPKLLLHGRERDGDVRHLPRRQERQEPGAEERHLQGQAAKPSEGAAGGAGAGGSAAGSGSAPVRGAGSGDDLGASANGGGR